jgi:hypothetical protein
MSVGALSSLFEALNYHGITPPVWLILDDPGGRGGGELVAGRKIGINYRRKKLMLRSGVKRVVF